MQPAVMAVTLPWLILLARTPAYSAVRMGVAVATALGWLGQRSGLYNPLSRLADRLGQAGPWVIVWLAGAAIFLTFSTGQRPRTGTGH